MRLPPLKLGVALIALAFLAGAGPLEAQQQPRSVDVVRATLANGLRVVVLRDTLAPVVTTYVNYLVGSDEAPIQGLAHAQEHMMFRGSKSLSAGQFSEIDETTGGDFDADTQNEVTQFYFTMPAQDLDIALHLERSRAEGILDSAQGWDQERGAITQEVTRDNSSASYRLYTRIVAHLFRGTPYAHTPLGTVGSFKRITSADLQAYYRRWYHPNNALLVVAGDVDPQATIAKVRSLFSDIPAAPLPPRPATHLQPPTSATFRDSSSAPYTVAFVAYRVPGYADRDYYAQDILDDVLSSQRGALYDLEATGAALSTFTDPSTFGPAGIEQIGVVVPAATPGERAAAQIERVIDQYKKTGVPADLVEAAKEHELAQAQFQRDSIEDLASLWSQDLAVEQRTPDDDLAGLRAVTVDDVNRVLRRYYDNATATIAIATPRAASGSAFGGPEAENNTVPPSKQEPLPAWARSTLASLRVPPETTHPVVSTLPNGIKLVVVRSTLTPTVEVRGSVLESPDLETPPGKDGLSDILDGLFSYGTTTYDRVAYQRQLDAIAANASAGSTFSLDVLADRFDRGMQLLADDELHPTLPADAFAVVKQQEVGTLRGAIKSPGYKAQIALARALYRRGYPGARHATPQSAARVTLDDVKAYYRRVYRPDLTTIVVVGDVTPQAARASLERWFGGWRASGPRPPVFDPPAPPNPVSQAYVAATGRIQADVTLAETLPLSYRDPAYPVLELGNAVLTGGFYASLLYHDIREIHGYAYTVDSSLDAGHYGTNFTISYGCDPQNIANAEQLVVADLAALQRKPIAADRLQAAKALVLGRLPVAKDSYDGLASQLLRYVSTGRAPDQDRRNAEAMLDASGATVQGAFAKYVRPRGFARVVIGPSGT